MNTYITHDIYNSEIFTAWVNMNFMQDAKCYAAWLYAQTYNMPFVVLFDRDITIPVDMLEGIDDIFLIPTDFEVDNPLVKKRQIEDAINKACEVLNIRERQKKNKNEPSG
jgi:hypothetical protein